MNLLNSRINRRTLGGITIGAAAASGLHLASAQDATPEVAEEEVAATLATLESAAQFDVIANANSYAIFQAGDNVPGWYVFNVENASEAPASFNLARLPEEVGVGDFTTFLFQMNTGALTEMPAWVADTVFAGWRHRQRAAAPGCRQVGCLQQPLRLHPVRHHHHGGRAGC